MKKNFYPVSAILSLLLLLSSGCSRTPVDRAENLYHSLKSEPSDRYFEIVEILENFNSKSQKESDLANILLWKSYIHLNLKSKSDSLERILLSRGAGINSLLTSNLKSENEIVREKIITLIGKTHDKSYVKFLIKYLEEDSFYNVQRASAYALSEIGDNRAVLPLIRKLHNNNSLIRYYAASALAGFPDSTVVKELVSVLKDTGETVDVRYRAVLSLGTLKEEIDIASMIGKELKKLNMDPISAILYAFTLSQIHDNSGYSTAMELVNSHNFFIKKLAIETLGNIANPNSIPILIETLKYGNSALRAAAAVSLGKIGSPEAEKALHISLNDPNPDVQKESRLALETIKEKRAHVKRSY